VLIAVDNDLERSAMGRHTSAPGLYFILDGVYYIVNHTHICNISVPQISANGEEPPSAFIGDHSILRWHILVTCKEICKLDSRSHLIIFIVFFFMALILSYGRMARGSNEMVSQSSLPSVFVMF
jgi:hypothetical protein